MHQTNPNCGSLNYWPNSLYISFSHIKCVLFKGLFALLLTPAFGQNLNEIGKSDPLRVNGFVSTNQMFTHQPGEQGSIDQYTGYYTGSLNLSIYDVNVPLTFIYSNRKGNFTHPFNQFGLHPAYKWITGHVGYASMNFSPYTLNGHLFLGTGVEIKPSGLFHASAMYGRLRKAVPYDTTRSQLTPAYQRIGYGIKVGMSKEKDCIDLIVFRAFDKIGSLDSIPESFQVMPQDNAVVSVVVTKSILDRLIFTGEYANSALTKDARASLGSEGDKLYNVPRWFIHSRTTTTNRQALKANLSYVLNRFSVGAGYERIDPDYTTLGAYYFTNNMENITVNFSSSFLDSKISLSGNAGLQNDNLDKNKMNNNKRFVGSGSVNIVPNEKHNLNASYSNFLSYTNVQSSFDYINQSSAYENWDTLNYRQISQNLNLNTSYQISGSKERRQNLSLNLTYQISDDKQGISASEKSRFYNASVSYIIGLTPQDLNISATVNYNRNEVTAANTSTWGPSLTISKLFLEKTLRTSLTGAYNTSTSNGASAGGTYNIRANGAYTLLKRHNLNLNILYQLRQRKGENITTRDFHSYTVTFGYVYSFNILDKKANNKDSKEN